MCYSRNKQIHPLLCSIRIITHNSSSDLIGHNETLDLFLSCAGLLGLGLSPLTLWLSLALLIKSFQQLSVLLPQAFHACQSQPLLHTQSRR
jgi:hypothetical protein